MNHDKLPDSNDNARRRIKGGQSMLLKKMQVTNFRSVEDSGEFDVDPVTCVVGKNESGKTALLTALASINPSDSTPVELDQERDYTRRKLTRYSELHPDKEAVVIRTVWELSEAQKAKIVEEIGEGVLKSCLVTIRKRYGSVDAGEPIEIDAKLDYAKAVDNLCRRFRLNAAERASLRSPDTTSEMLGVLNDLASPTPKQVQLREYLGNGGHALGRVRRIVRQSLPRFMYFSSYDRMDGAIQIEQTQQRISTQEIELDEHRGARLFVDFLDYAGVPIGEITTVNTYETFNARLQAASARITDQVLEYWSQNPDLEVDVRITKALSGDAAPFNQGTIARARVKNNLHRVDTAFSERSAGFVWFFSFLVKFAQVTRANGPVILVLDEPGLSLHGAAQGDLLGFIEKELAPHHQVVYSTHSQFMIPPDALDRVRIVEDKVEVKDGRRVPRGTKVTEDVLEVDGKTLFPLLGALGIRATQSLFIGEHTLLVEGPSDILYLQAMSNELRSRKRTFLDPRWTLCPSGGIERMMPFITLFAGNELHVAALSDRAHGKKKEVERIRQSEILRAGHFYTIADFIDADEGDVEDLFSPELYVDIVNRSYELSGEHQVTVQKLDADTSTPRIVKKVEKLFNVMPPETALFSHYAPADWLLRNPEALSGESEAVERTLSVAEKIFQTFNALLD